tara:strand:- start:543 stop:1769 length:1227 start_codon:yes stop_codon:yes gene_type:complete
MKSKKKILIIIGGGISAYKSLDLIRLFKKNNYDVKVILTSSGKKFVTPLSLKTIVGSKPFEDIFENDTSGDIDHISLSRWADIILAVPATANFLSRISVGKADDLASTVLLAANKQIFLVPAMNVRMWLHPATQENFKKLVGFGYNFIGPEKGEMACGEYGEGKMSSPRQIYAEIKKFFSEKNIIQKKKLKALVTAGPTREYIDPVRYISNESSGKQGYEIAKALSRAGVKTTLISGPVELSPVLGIKIIKVISASQMLKEVIKNLPVDIVICAAAVSDYKPKIFNSQKIKKDTNKLQKIEFEKNTDILEFLGKNNKHRPGLVVGFSAETENLIKNSKEKLSNKNCDLIIANDVSKKDIGFNKNFNSVVILDAKSKKFEIKKSKKSFVAEIIAKKILEKFLVNDKNPH